MQTDDKTPDKTTLENVHAEHGSSIQRLTVVLPEDARGYLRWINGMSIGLAFAIVLSLGAAMFCFFTEAQEERRVYFTSRCEGFVEQLAFEQKPIHPSDLDVICNTREK